MCSAKRRDVFVSFISIKPINAAWKNVVAATIYTTGLRLDFNVRNVPTRGQMCSNNHTGSDCKSLDVYAERTEQSIEICRHVECARSLYVLMSIIRVNYDHLRGKETVIHHLQVFFP